MNKKTTLLLFFSSYIILFSSAISFSNEDLMSLNSKVLEKEYSNLNTQDAQFLYNERMNLSYDYSNIMSFTSDENTSCMLIQAQSSSGCSTGCSYGCSSGCSSGCSVGCY